MKFLRHLLGTAKLGQERNQSVRDNLCVCVCVCVCVCAEHCLRNVTVSTKVSTTRRENAQKWVMQVGITLQARRKKKYK